MRVTVLADTLAFAVHPSTTAAEESFNFAELIVADQTSFLIHNDTQNRYDDPPKQNWWEEIQITQEFNSPGEGFLSRMSKFQDM